MKKFKELLKLCKASVSISVNGHKDYYETVDDYIEIKSNIPNDIFNKMVELDTIVYIQAYPDTPVGFYEVYHYDIDQAIDLMIEIILESRK